MTGFTQSWVNKHLGNLDSHLVSGPNKNRDIYRVLFISSSNFYACWVDIFVGMLFVVDS